MENNSTKFTYIIPVVAIMLGYLFINETLSIVQIIGALIVFVGVYFSSRK
jgi:drug/metabolite transporter (DMT)-like permease